MQRADSRKKTEPREYREEHAVVPVAAAILAVLLAGGPLGAMVFKSNKDGQRSSNVSRYTVLVETVAESQRIVDALLSNDDERLAAINRVRKPSDATLRIPDVVIVPEEKQDETKPLQVELEAIYWSPTKPLAGINGKTYQVGDTVLGYEIVGIGKSKVRFRSAAGEIVVKDMNENLFNSRN